MTDWRRVDVESLRRAVLSPTALVPLIQADPAKAAELVLAATFESPHRRADPFAGLRPSLGVVDHVDRGSPLPERGPMLGFLVHAPKIGLATALQIAERATAAWAASEWAGVDDLDLPPFEMVLDGKRVTLAGNGNVMHWHRGDSRVPDSLACTLMAIEQFLYRTLDAGESIDNIAAQLMASRSLAVFGVLVEVACRNPELLLGPLAPLATSPGLILADRMYKAVDHAYLGALIFSETEFRRLQRWHGLPHRKVTLEHQIMVLALGDGALTDELAAARELCASHDETSWKLLAAGLDPANYRSAEAGGGERAWEFELPADLQPAVDADIADVQARQWWATAPYSLAKWIEDGLAASDEQAQALWDDVQERLGDCPPADDSDRRVTDVECGLAAALVLCAPAWSQRRPEVMAFCRRALLAPLAHPAPPDELGFPDAAAVPGKWDGFVARALPVLWAREPADEDLRRAAARLATHHRHDTVRTFFAAATEIPALAADVCRLEVVALHWSRFVAWSRERHRREQHSEAWLDDGPALEDLPDLATATGEVLEAFVGGTLTTEAPSLEEFVAAAPEGLVPKVHSARYQLAYSIDVSYLLAAWDHVLRLAEGLAAGERVRRLTVGAQFARTLAAGLVPGERGRVDGTPYDEERKLLELLAAMTAVSAPEEARPIWQPILERGTVAHYWIDNYLNELWTAALGPPEPPAGFAGVIQAMMHFAARHESWRGAYRDELDLALLCLNRWGHPRMKLHHLALFRALQPEWAALAERHVRSAYAARSIVAFLAEPVAAGVVDTGLQWLAEREASDERPDDDLDDVIAETLVKLAGREPGLFRRSTAARDVLRGLAGRQNAVALQLSAQLSRRG